MDAEVLRDVSGPACALSSHLASQNGYHRGRDDIHITLQYIIIIFPILLLVMVVNFSLPLIYKLNFIIGIYV